MKVGTLIDLLKHFDADVEVFIPCEPCSPGVVRTTDKAKVRILRKKESAILLVPGEGPWSETEFEATNG